MSMLSELFAGNGGKLPSGATYWMGVTTTALTDGATTNPITINGESATAEVGGIASYSNKEFIWNGSAWQEFGSDAVLSVNGRTGAVQVAELPAVTGSDNNKVLKVVSGAWAAAEDEFVVTFTKSGSTWSADQNTIAIAEAITAKKRVYGKVAASLVSTNSAFLNQTLLLPLMASNSAFGTGGGYPFSGTIQTGSTTLFVNIVVSLVPPLNQAVTAYINEIELSTLPSVSSGDDFKVLTVYDGGWVKADACFQNIYTVTGLPVDGVYPLACSQPLSVIQDALSQGANLRAMLTVGTDTAILSPASVGTDYVTFSNVVMWDGAWAIFCVEHNVDQNDNETCKGYIIPLNTAQMSYNATSGELSITNVPEVSS